ncbi:MAG TPA: PKD domain-containing protein, partial [Candidatus Eisenbacteria bacterium]|nr:PKD domain-containing protein [Candidatus Eisenbacteria bacterium]
SDPDGDPISCAWQFGDGSQGGGFSLAHIYDTAGVFNVTLTVSDRQLSASASTTATVEDFLASQVFTTNANRVLRLGSGKSTWCVQLEALNGAYQYSDLDPTSLNLYVGIPSVPALLDKSSVGADKNGNGVEELTLCFSKEALRAALSYLPRGTTTRTFAVYGNTLSGSRIWSEFEATVSSPGGLLSSSVSPNPMNPEAVLTFVTSRSGWARVSLFDLQGRLVRRVLDQTTLDAGIHDVRVDGLRDDGARLPSGVYFYRVETAEGASLGRLVVAK